LLEEEIFRKKNCGENQNTFFMFSKLFFPKIALFMR